jgi:hypothetical protein
MILGELLDVYRAASDRYYVKFFIDGFKEAK